MNAMYKSSRSASKSILAGGMNPKLKNEAFKTIGTYYKALGRFMVNETSESTLSSSLSSFINETSKELIRSIGGW